VFTTAIISWLRHRADYAAVCVALLSVVAQASSLRGFFQCDDYLHLYELAVQTPWQLASEQYLGHILFTFRAALLLLHSVFGFDPKPYFITMLLTHGANAGLLCRISRRFAGPRIGMFVSALWGVAPVHQGALDFISVYGHVLSTTSLLVSLLLLFRYLDHADRLALGAVPLVLLLGVGSFGTGIAVAMVFPAVGWLLAPPGRRARTAAYLSPLLLVPVSYVLLVNWSQAAAWGIDPFTSLAKLRLLVGYGLAAFLLGPFCTIDSESTAGWLFRKLTPEDVISFGQLLWLPMAGLLVLAALANRSRERTTIAASLLWPLAAYTMIALARPVGVGSLADQAVIPRYQYLPLTGVAVAVSAALASVVRAVDIERWRRHAVVLGSAYILVLAVGSFDVGRRMWSVWLDSRAWVSRCIRFFSWAAAQSPRGSDVYVSNEPFFPTTVVMMAGGKSIQYPGIAAFFASIYPDDVLLGRRFHFVETDRAVLAGADASNARMRALLISAEAINGRTVQQLTDFRE
jgi:hypothetical protein